MRKCTYCKSEIEAAELRCKFCGGTIFTDLEETEQRSLPPATVNNRTCCPNPNCPETTFSNTTKYCAECGSLLAVNSFDLWVSKFVNPALEKEFIEALENPAPLFGAAERMGFDSQEAERFLNRYLKRLAGQDTKVVGKWARETLRPLTKMSSVSLPQQLRAIQEAERTGLNRKYVERVIARLAPLTASPIKPREEESEAAPKPIISPPGESKKGLLRTIAVVVACLVVAAVAMLYVAKKKPNTGNVEMNSNDVKPTPTQTASFVPPEMVVVTGGEFLMGRSDGEDYERPSHKVAVKTFLIDKYEVTCEEYKKFIEATHRRPPANWIDGQYPKGTGRWPVVGVDWDDANAYARWSDKRLPTEEEWEYAARGTSGWLYPWGNQWKEGTANADANSSGQLANVGAQVNGASPFGAFDMVGNAWEWTASSLKPYPGAQISNMPKGERKVFRGGSWQSNKNLDATATYRGFALPRGGRDYSSIGFRCAKDYSAP